ncbi:Scr1 family TA system antitoxin-like transcriptional regulator [Kitasatospora sp. NPDC056783]|uniref:Scr1 family TA system antitoxin-like transcriptional regulator n=1 Tax=Kitasatospora sp. NPDC056783 TaxID=3345943 RepID=UPI0036AB57EA
MRDHRAVLTACTGDLHTGGPHPGALLLGACLRAERMTADLGLGQAASSIRGTVHDLAAIECGHRPPGPGQVRRLLGAYGTDPAGDPWTALPAIAARLHTDGPRPDFEDTYPGWAGRLLQAARGCRQVRATAALVVPLGLRTHRYGMWIAGTQGAPTPDDLDHLTVPLDPASLGTPRWTVLLGEATAVQFGVPGLAGQLDHLIRLSEKRVIDLRLATQPGPDTELLELHHPAGSRHRLLAEAGPGGVTYRTGEAAAARSRQTDVLLARSRDPATSRVLLSQVSTHLATTP